MSSQISAVASEFTGEIKKNSGLIIALGIIVLLMGFFAMGSPLIAGLSIALVVGILLIIGGLGQLVFAIKARSGFFSIILGVLTVIIGIYMAANPAAALASLTLFLAMYLIFSGVSEAIMAFQVKPAAGWGWTLFSGVMSVILGIMIWSQFPLSGAWAVGILIGVRLLFSGWALLMFGMAARGAANEVSR